MWAVDVAMFVLVGRAYDLDLELGAYFLLEGIGNLALAVPATAAGLGSFDYLTYLTARDIEISESDATAYVLTMHALLVLPVTLLGALLVAPALPRLFRRRRGPGAQILPLEPRQLVRPPRRLAPGLGEAPLAGSRLEQLGIDRPALGPRLVERIVDGDAGRARSARPSAGTSGGAAGAGRRRGGTRSPERDRRPGYARRRAGRRRARPGGAPTGARAGSAPRRPRSSGPISPSGEGLPSGKTSRRRRPGGARRASGSRRAARAPGAPRTPRRPAASPGADGLPQEVGELAAQDVPHPLGRGQTGRLGPAGERGELPRGQEVGQVLVRALAEELAEPGRRRAPKRMPLDPAEPATDPDREERPAGGRRQVGGKPREEPRQEEVVPGGEAQPLERAPRAPELAPGDRGAGRGPERPSRGDAWRGRACPGRARAAPARRRRRERRRASRPTCPRRRRRRGAPRVGSIATWPASRSEVPHRPSTFPASTAARTPWPSTREPRSRSSSPAATAPTSWPGKTG